MFLRKIATIIEWFRSGVFVLMNTTKHTYFWEIPYSFQVIRTMLWRRQIITSNPLTVTNALVLLIQEVKHSKFPMHILAYSAAMVVTPAVFISGGRRK